jgi:hypothetical protein
VAFTIMPEDWSQEEVMVQMAARHGAHVYHPVKATS